jgi:hypothetical protein
MRDILTTNVSQHAAAVMKHKGAVGMVAVVLVGQHKPACSNYKCTRMQCPTARLSAVMFSA